MLKASLLFFYCAAESTKGTEWEIKTQMFLLFGKTCLVYLSLLVCGVACVVFKTTHALAVELRAAAVKLGEDTLPLYHSKNTGMLSA